MRGINRILWATAALLTAAVSMGQAQPPKLVNFVFKPVTQNVVPGGTAIVSLWAFPTGADVPMINGFEAVITWDTNVVSFAPNGYTGATSSGSNSFTAGTNGVGDLSIFDVNPSYTVAAAGIKFGDLKFNVSPTAAPGTTAIGMISAGDIVVDANTKFGGNSTVYRLSTNGDSFNPFITSTSQIKIVPEPNMALGLIVGLVALRARRKS